MADNNNNDDNNDDDNNNNQALLNCILNVKSFPMKKICKGFDENTKTNVY